MLTPHGGGGLQYISPASKKIRGDTHRRIDCNRLQCNAAEANTIWERKSLLDSGEEQ
jgi:hypothetical protein